MPSDSNVLGFANRWYPLAVETAQRVELPSDLPINLVAAPLFLATKFEAFHDRGRDDWLGSHDLEDIINVLDGRPELVDEIAASQSVVRDALAAYTKNLLAQPQFVSALPGLIFPDESQELRLRLLEQCIRKIAEF
jgi:predicted nucleotidyltransferase